MKLITQDGLLTDTAWWQAINVDDNELNLIKITDDDEILTLQIAELPTKDDIDSLNKAIVSAFSYEGDGLTEFNVQRWEEENLI